ncbi:MAG: LemA family protein [Gluconacetobacter diazotrophicus]|nr:LemA family protein [Gluconacetobacter diazotrophicus]
MQKTAVLGCLGILVLIAIVVALIGVSGYNGLNVKSNAVDGKWADVQASYQRRNDLIPNLVSTVQASANFEKSTLTDVINARANATKVTVDPSHAPTDPAQLAAYQNAQSQLTGSLSRLLVSVEKYPELGATKGFRDLQSQIEGTENRINDARNKFNAAAVDYNTSRTSFPNILFANLFGMKEKPPFKADDAAQAAPRIGSGTFDTPTPAPAATAH